VTAGDFSGFVTRVGNRLGMEPRSWKNSKAFGHLGIVAGWGARPEWMAQAQALGCDTFLSGEAGYFGLLFAKEAGLNLILAGHYVTEVPGMMALGARVARDLHLDVTFIPEEILENKQ
jgi:putative NIF3 family GTP cyclohydrolase 1 type 2